jgi:predicted amidohydrolase
MKVCVAQTKPVKGDIQTNLDHHKRFIELAVSKGAELIIFPELSLTGYEPTLAKELAIEINDRRFDELQTICDKKEIVIGAGVPVKNGEAVSIGMLIFQPNKKREVYFKKYLHADELPFFVSGESFKDLSIGENRIGLAICYELSVSQHAEDAIKNGAAIYIASVAKTKKGTEKAIERLSEIAREYNIPVLYSNCVGICDGDEMGGQSSVWNNKGELKDQLNESDEGVLIFDTVTQKAVEASPSRLLSGPKAGLSI